MDEQMKKEVEALLFFELTPGQMIVKMLLESLAEKYKLKDTNLFWKLLNEEIEITDEIDGELGSVIKDCNHWVSLQKYYDEVIENKNTISC